MTNENQESIKISSVEEYYDYILDNEIILNKFKQKYPEISDILEVSKDNRMCPCKLNAINYLNIKLNITEDYEFIFNLLKEKIEEIFSKHSCDDGTCDHDHNPKPQNLVDFTMNYGGVAPEAIIDQNLYKIFKVKKGDQEWKDFMTEVRKTIIFSSFSIVDKGDYLEVYFI